MNKFKVGDRVRVTTDPLYSGETGTVFNPNDGTDYMPVWVAMDEHWDLPFDEDELELVGTGSVRAFAEARRDDPSNDAVTTRYWVGYLDGFDAAGAS